MQQQIRLGVFETNSSSSHSLTLTQGDLVSSPFDADTMRKGLVEVGMNEYGWEWHRYYTARNKLSYLLTQVLRSDQAVPEGDHEEVTRALCEKHPELAMLVRVVKDHTGCDLRFIAGSSGYIDHESDGEGMHLFRSEEELKHFLFTESSYVQTGNDNDPAPTQIDTDRSPEFDDFYVAHYREPKAGWLALRFHRESDWGAVTFVTQAGVTLSSTEHGDLFQALVEQGTFLQVECDEQNYYSTFEHEDPRSGRMGALARHGWKFSAALQVTTSYQMISYEDKTSERYFRQTYTIAMPGELAVQIQALTV